MNYPNYPFHLNSRGRTQSTNSEEHIRQLIEQILFTIPGERVNRPSFGGGVHRLLFFPLSDDLVATTRSVISSSLNEYLSNLIIVEDIDVSFDDSKLIIDIQYVLREDQSKKKERFERALQ
jgi:uncharacterized protein